MSAVAISDIVYMFHNFYLRFIQFARAYSGCIEERTYGMVLADVILRHLLDFAKRSSILFCVWIALIRILVIRNPMSSFYESLSNPFTAYITISGVTLVSLSLSAFKATFYRIVAYSDFNICNSKIKIQAFSYMLHDFFDNKNSLVLQYFNTTDSIVSIIIPCICFPFLTLLLVLELKKKSENRSKMFSSPNDDKTRKFTQLVFYFTLTFFVAGFPLGVASTMMYLFIGMQGFLSIFTFISYILEVLYIINTASHFLVCILVSSQYRETVKSVISCGRHKVGGSGTS
ncbi:hypothetical protein B9Z55_017856 [Caenorhabditis nigoni]|nr:hypothetical protein B9Z55_017856 [Caenorhabditis nigoni]